MLRQKIVLYIRVIAFIVQSVLSESDSCQLSACEVIDKIKTNVEKFHREYEELHDKNLERRIRSLEQPSEYD